MPPQQEYNSSFPANNSWMINLFQRCQVDPNQTAIDFVQHAYSSLYDAPDAVTLALQILAHRILLEVDRKTTLSVEEQTTTRIQETLPTPNLFVPPLPNILEPPISTLPIPPMENSTITIKQENDQGTQRDMMEIDNATRPRGLGVTETLQRPVEKLCIKTGNLLERYPTGLAAQATVSKCSQAHFFYYAVVGKNKGTPPHIYKKFFWRLEGSTHRPGGCPCHYEVQEENSTSNPAATNNSNIKRDPLRDASVEKLCLETGRVVERFATAEEAHRSVSESGTAQFGNFKKVLEGKGHFSHHIYKGHFWRLAGSNKLPNSCNLKRKKRSSVDGNDTTEESSFTEPHTHVSQPSLTLSNNKNKKNNKDNNNKKRSKLSHVTIPPAHITEQVNENTDILLADAQAQTLKSFTPRRSRRLLAESSSNVKIEEV